MLTRKFFTAALVVAGALAAGACSDNNARTVSAAPSPVTVGVSGSGSDRNSASALGVASEGLVQDPAVVAQWAASVGWAAIEFEAQGVGDITAVSGSCATTLTFTILGIPVNANSSTIFENGTCGDLAAGRRVDVSARLVVSSGTLSVVASRVDFVAAGETEFEGRVQTVTGACATGLTITLTNAKVITTTATTVFDPTSSCSTIAPGIEVEARGTTNSSGQLVATRVEVEGAGGEVRIEGRVQTMTGTCPALSLTMDDGTIVTTTMTTIFSPDNACLLLAEGARIRVRGTRTSATTIAASRIDLRDNGRKKLGGQVTINSITGTCPNLTMNVHGVRVTTNSSTVFENGECGNLRPGTKVVIEVETEGTGAVATLIRITDQPGGNRELEGEGTVGSVTGTCPTLTMVVNGTSVMTTSQTTFADGTCSDIRAGTRIRAKGTFQGGSLVATEVRIRSGNSGPGN